MELDDIKTYEEMNKSIVGHLMFSENPSSMYAAKRITELEAENAELKDRIKFDESVYAELKEESTDEDSLRFTMAATLTAIANIVKGEPEPLHRHSWHDLPDATGDLIASLAVDISELKMENAKLREVRDEHIAKVISLLDENAELRKGLIEVAQETVQRGVIAARMEAEVMAIRDSQKDLAREILKNIDGHTYENEFDEAGEVVVSWEDILHVFRTYGITEANND